MRNEVIDVPPTGETVVWTRDFQHSEQTRRDSYIKAAMQGLLASGQIQAGYEASPAVIAQRAVRIADAVIQEADQ